MELILQNGVKNKLSKVVALLGSTSLGEREAALEACNRLLASNDLTWIDISLLLQQEDDKPKYKTTATGDCPSQADCYQMLIVLEKHTDKMNEWSKKFVCDLLKYYFGPREKKLTENQRLAVRRLYTNITRKV